MNMDAILKTYKELMFTDIQTDDIYKYCVQNSVAVL